MRHRGKLLRWMVFPVLLGACSSRDRSEPYQPAEFDEKAKADIPSDRLPTTLPLFVETKCEQKVEGHVTQCGLVSVPESAGSDTKIQIAVARVFSNSTAPSPDPIVYLEGGPGVPSLANLSLLYDLLQGNSPDRDFVFIDQRGLGQSLPRLRCFNGEEDILGSLDQCFGPLSLGADLNAYNSINSATDIDWIRQAFGYEQWNLLGISYGTRLGLTIMRDHPVGVRSVLLDSVVPLHTDTLAEVGHNAYEALGRMNQACADDEACAQMFPDTLGQLTSLIPSLDENPFALEVDVGDSSVEFLITGELFMRFVFEVMYSPYGIELVPLLVSQASEREFSTFVDLFFSPGQEEAGEYGEFSFAMHLSLRCSEEFPFTNRSAFDRFDGEVPRELRRSLSGERYLDYCQHWPVLPAPTSENEPVKSSLPTLVLAGHFDPITPPANAESVHNHLTNSQFIVVDNESHGVSAGECGQQMARAFFDAPTDVVDVDCLTQLSSLQFRPLSQRRADGEPWPRGQAQASNPSGPLHMRTEEPDKEEVERIRDQLRRRLR